MRHRMYKFACENLVKSKATQELLGYKYDKKKGLSSILAGLKEIYTTQNIEGSLEPLIHSEEYNWLKEEKPKTYFFESSDLVDKIANGAHRIKDFGFMDNMTDSFVLTLPGDSPLNKGGSGLLVTVGAYRERAETLIPQFFKAMGLGRPLIADDEFEGNVVINICYSNKAIGSLGREASRMHSYWFRNTTPDCWLQQVLAMTNPGEYVDYVNSENKYEYDMLSQMDDSEIEQQFQIVKLVVGFLVYRQAMPHRFSTGYPIATEFGTQLTKREHPINVSAPRNENGDKAGHYRSWHLRQLMHDKYYKGEYEKYEKGSRIVFVSDSVVGMKITPETVRG